MECRLMADRDIARLHEIRAEYVSDRCLRVVRTGQSPEISILLQVESLGYTFGSQGLTIVGERDKAETRSRLAGQTLQVVAEDQGRLVALLDAEVESWRRVLKVWNLLVHEEYRRRGIGTRLMRSAEAFALEKHCRAISIETQATNWPALSLYLKLGFEVCGVDDHFYTNRDLAHQEVALFLYRDLT
jgi:ribosomal protein S18 acetylase RimI-like enzyme